MATLPEAAFTEVALNFATEVYRVFTHPRGFDLGNSLAFGDDFALMAWAGNTFFSEPDTAALIHKYRRLASKSEDTTPLWHVESPTKRHEANFIEYATEAVADAWCEKPLTSEQVADIAERAMEYAYKKPIE